MEIVLEGNVSDIAIIHGLFISALLKQACTCGPLRLGLCGTDRGSHKVSLKLRIQLNSFY